ncbi:hypothetical protein GCM10028771_20910 [Nocardioides marmoraquaticus]
MAGEEHRDTDEQGQGEQPPERVHVLMVPGASRARTGSRPSAPRRGGWRSTASSYDVRRNGSGSIGTLSTKVDVDDD